MKNIRLRYVPRDFGGIDPLNRFDRLIVTADNQGKRHYRVAELEKPFEKMTAREIVAVIRKLLEMIDECQEGQEREGERKWLPHGPNSLRCPLCGKVNTNCSINNFCPSCGVEVKGGVE